MNTQGRTHTTTALLWAVLTAAAVGIGLADGPALAPCVGAAVAAFLVVRGVPWQAAAPVGVAMPAAGVAACVAVRLGESPARVVALLAVGAVALLVTARLTRDVRDLTPVVVRRGETAGAVMIVVAILVRHVVPLATTGHLGWRTGQVVLGPVVLQAGELTRLLVVMGLVVGLRAAVETRRPWPVLLLTAVYVVPLLYADQGPAVLTVLGALVAVQLVLHPDGVPRAGTGQVVRLGVGVAAGVLALLLVLPFTRDRLLARVAETFDPSTSSQLGYALNGLRRAGLVSAPSETGVHMIPEARHDFVVAAIGSALGLAVMVAALAAVGCCLLVLAQRCARVHGTRAMVARALLLMLLAQTCWAVLGNLGVIALTGVSASVLTMTGSAVLQTALVLGLAAGAVGRTEHAYPAVTDASARGARMVTTATAAMTTLAVAGFALGADTPTLAASYGMPRGAILDATGTPVTSDDGAGTTTSRAGFDVAGTHSRVHRTASGLELSLNDDLTCGGGHSLLERLSVVLRPLPCHPADVVTSLDPTLQPVVARAVRGAESSLVVLDARTGAVRAIGSSFDERTADGPPGSTFKVVTAAAALDASLDTEDVPLDELDLAGERLANIDGFRCPDPSIATALTHSCNTTMGWSGVELGARRLDAFARSTFGTGTSLGVEGTDGAVPDVVTGLDGSLTAPEVARSAIGQQGVRATVLGVAAIGAVVAEAAHGRSAPQPRLVVGRCEDGVVEPADPAPPIAKERLDRDTARALLDAMREGARRGSAARLDARGHELAVKTGTADQQVVGADGAVTFHTRSWVLAVVDERHVVAAQVYVPASTHENMAVPLVQQVLDSLASTASTATLCGAAS